MIHFIKNILVLSPFFKIEVFRLFIFFFLKLFLKTICTSTLLNGIQPIRNFNENMQTFHTHNLMSFSLPN